MKKICLTLFSMLFMLAGTVNAETTVTFIPGNEVGSQTSANGPDEMTKDGITISVTKGAFAAPQYRFAKGSTMTISSSVGNITAVQFQCTAENDAQYGPGCFTDNTSGIYVYSETVGLWAGNASSFSMTASVAQVRAMAIIVTVGGDPGDNPGIDPGGDDDEDGFDIIDGRIIEEDSKVTLYFTAVEDKHNVEVTGLWVFNFDENNVCNGSIISVTYPTEEMAQIAFAEAEAEQAAGDYLSVSLSGTTVTADSEEFNGTSRDEILIMLNFLLTGDIPSFTGSGTLEDPFTPQDASLMASLLDQGEIDEVSYYIKGKISDIKYTFSAQYGTATFSISEDGTTNNQFLVYSTYYLENKPWVEGNTQIQLGDDVIIYGQLTNYNGTAETASKKSYIYSLNGKTKNESGDTPGPEVTTISVEQALDIINEELADGKTTAETYRVKGYVVNVNEISTSYGNATFVIADSKNDATGLTIFRAKGFDGQKIEDENYVKVGDEVVVEGKLQRYVKNEEMTPEMAAGGIIISINGRTSISDITLDAACQKVYNLQGQRVKDVQKGLYIIDGKKVLVK